MREAASGEKVENVPLGRGGREFKAVDKTGGEKQL